MAQVHRAEIAICSEYVSVCIDRSQIEETPLSGKAAERRYTSIISYMFIFTTLMTLYCTCE